MVGGCKCILSRSEGRERENAMVEEELVGLVRSASGRWVPRFGVGQEWLTDRAVMRGRDGASASGLVQRGGMRVRECVCA